MNSQSVSKHRNILDALIDVLHCFGHVALLAASLLPLPYPNLLERALQNLENTVHES